MKMKKSFTVVELLMAVALTIVIGTLVSMAFNNTQLASRRLTSTLEYQIKGRAIMDLLAQDLRNSTSSAMTGATDPLLTSSLATPFDGFNAIGAMTALPSLLSPYTASAVSSAGIDKQCALMFKTYLPIQNTHYQATPGTAAATTALGYYVKSIVDVGWYYVWYRSGANPSTNDFTQLFRYVTTPEAAAAGSGVSVTSASNFSFNSTGAVLPKINILTRQNVITLNDIRNFEINALPAGVGTKKAYQIKFALTNAPISAAPPSGGFIDNRKDAEELGYVWVEFERIVPVAPY